MRSDVELQSCLSTTPQERQEFYARWNLDLKCRELVEAQPPFVQRELIANFKPPSGTVNMAGKMTAFLKMIRTKTDQRNTSDSRVEDFISQWGLDTGARQALLRLPTELQESAMQGFRPGGRTESVSKKFIAYLKSLQAKSQSFVPGNALPQEHVAAPFYPPAWPFFVPPAYSHW